MKAFEYGVQFGPNVNMRGDGESHGFNVKARTCDYITFSLMKDLMHHESLQTREDHWDGAYEMDGSIGDVEMSYVYGGRSMFRKDHGDPGGVKYTPKMQTRKIGCIESFEIGYAAFQGSQLRCIQYVQIECPFVVFVRYKIHSFPTPFLRKKDLE